MWHSPSHQPWAARRTVSPTPKFVSWMQQKTTHSLQHRSTPRPSLDIGNTRVSPVPCRLHTLGPVWHSPSHQPWAAHRTVSPTPKFAPCSGRSNPLSSRCSTSSRPGPRWTSATRVSQPRPVPPAQPRACVALSPPTGLCPRHLSLCILQQTQQPSLLSSWHQLTPRPSLVTVQRRSTPRHVALWPSTWTQQGHTPPPLTAHAWPGTRLAREVVVSGDRPPAGPAHSGTTARAATAHARQRRSQQRHCGLRVGLEGRLGCTDSAFLSSGPQRPDDSSRCTQIDPPSPPPATCHTVCSPRHRGAPLSCPLLRGAALRSGLGPRGLGCQEHEPEAGRQPLRRLRKAVQGLSDAPQLRARVLFGAQ